VPQLLDRHAHSLFHMFECFFEHGWHLNILFADIIGTDSVIAPSAFLHLIVASAWRANYRAVETEIKDVSFKELHKPDMATNTKLHHLRELLARVRGGAAQTSKYVPTHVRDFYAQVYADPGHNDRMGFETPIDQLGRISEEAAELQRFLMDSFQLLISSLSVIETVTSAKLARVGLEQASRGAKLTQLAFIYVPLSFCTGVFGMNIKEINGSPLSAWVCAVTLVVIIAATTVVFGGYELFRRVHHGRNEQDDEAVQSAYTLRPMPGPQHDPHASGDTEKTAGTAGLWSP
jgi:hypothetical protein